MSYKIIQPPFTLQFREMSKDELRQYFAWFLEVMPVRLNALREAVSATQGFEELVLDGSTQSLKGLGDWFVAAVEVRGRTADEINEIQSRSKHTITVPDTELSNRTFSIAMDIGMYFARVMLLTHPHLNWEQPLKDKKFVDYGQPILIGAGRVPLNPVRLMVILAYGFVSKAQKGSRLAEIFEYWSRQATTTL